MRTLNTNKLTEKPKRTKTFSWNNKRRFNKLSTY
jgi:hypothetical protein